MSQGHKVPAPRWAWDRCVDIGCRNDALIPALTGTLGGCTWLYVGGRGTEAECSRTCRRPLGWEARTQ